MPERFSADARRVLVYAQHDLMNLQHHEITTEHLLMGLLHAQDSWLQTTLRDAGVTPTAIRPHTEPAHQRSPRQAGYASFAADAVTVFQSATASERDLDKPVTPTDLLHAMLSSPNCAAVRLLLAADVDVDALAAVISQRCATSNDPEV